MKPQLIRHLISLGLATPVFGIAAWCAWSEPRQLNPWNESNFNLWFLVLPQLVCSTGIIVNGLLAVRSCGLN